MPSSPPSKTAKRLRNLLGLVGKAKPAVGCTPADVVHSENKWRLLRYHPRAQGLAHATPILLVPSLINRHYVLDLQPGRSFAEFMVSRGHDVFIIDWGTPGDEDRFITFDEICDHYIGRAVRRAARAAGTRSVHLLGYCLGGTLTAIHTAANPEAIATLTTLAAPIDFDDGGLLSRWTRGDTFDVDALVDGFGNVPWRLLQASFEMLRPTLNLSKAVSVLDRAWDDEFLDGFRAIERWGGDNVSFPGECYRRYIRDLYRDNALLDGRFMLSGRPAALDAIHCPLMSVTFEHDNIVPLASAEPLAQLVSSQDVTELHLRGGHVGAVVSRKAAKGLWPTLSNWWAARDEEQALSEPPSRAAGRSSPQ